MGLVAFLLQVLNALLEPLLCNSNEGEDCLSNGRDVHMFVSVLKSVQHFYMCLCVAVHCAAFLHVPVCCSALCSISTCACVLQCIPYSALLEELEITNVRNLEVSAEHTGYSGLVNYVAMNHSLDIWNMKVK